MLCYSYFLFLTILHGCTYVCVYVCACVGWGYGFGLLCQEGGLNGFLGGVMDTKPDSTGNCA